MSSIQEIDLDKRVDEEIKMLREKLKFFEEKTPQNEKEFLEMSNHFKEIVEKKDKEVIKYKRKFYEERKKLGRVYGLICELQDFMENSTDIGGDPIYETLSGTIRSLVSTAVFGDLEKLLGLDEEDAVVYLFSS
tara:strand:+ start:81 stop:482 length:402 start_codon:yes stop_codon:yes gene_type:complete